MRSLFVSYTVIKTAYGKVPVYYQVVDNGYAIYATLGPYALVSIITDPSDVSDFTSNFLAQSILVTSEDDALAEGATFTGTSGPSNFIHINSTITSSGSTILTGFGEKEIQLIVNITAAPTGSSPTIQFTIQQVDPGDQTTLFGPTDSTSVINSTGVYTATLHDTSSGAIQVSWTVGGGTPSFTGVYTTVISKVGFPTQPGGAVQVSGTVTANVGTTGGLALDATLTGGTQTTRVTDGTNTAAVKAASTPPSATDPALVVAISPNSSITATNPSVGTTGSAVPASATQIGGTDGTNLQAPHVFDADSGAGTQYVLGTQLRKSASGGSVEAGTATDPLRVDPTGATTQPVSGTVTANVGTTGGLALDATLTGGAQTTRITDGTNTAAVKAASTPAVATDQALVVAISPNNSITASNPSVGTNNAAAPSSSTQVGGTDGTNLQAAFVFDADSGGGTQYVLGTVLRKSASGGSVEAGTATDPLRVDPTGTTAQPVTDDGGSLTIDTPQLPAALVGGRLDTNVGTWLGSSAPSVGQKGMGDSVPVTIAFDQSAFPTFLTPTDNAGISPLNALNANASVDVVAATGLAIIAGTLVGTIVPEISLDGGTTWVATVFVSPAGVKSSTLSGTFNTDAVYDIELVGGVSQARVRVSAYTSGSSFAWVRSKQGLPSTQFGLTDAELRASAVPVSGTVTANVGTTGGLALDATLTGGTTKAIVRGGTKGATTPADVTSTAEGADHQALDIQIYHGGTAKDPTQIRALTNTDVVSDEITKWIGSTAPTVGQKTMANSLPVAIASDQSAVTVTGTVTATNPSVGATGSAVPASATQIGGSDGTNLQAPRVFDADTGGGTQYVLGTVLRKSASGGSVEAGTASDPLRVDPTGTTTQPISGTVTANVPQPIVVGVLDPNNSTATPLSASATYTGTYTATAGYLTLNLYIYVAPGVGGSDGSFFVTWSSDGSGTDANDDIDELFAWSEPIPTWVHYQIIIKGPYYRLNFTNDGPDAQVAFHLVATLDTQLADPTVTPETTAAPGGQYARATLIAGADSGRTAHLLRTAFDGSLRVDPTGATTQPVSLVDRQATGTITGSGQSISINTQGVGSCGIQITGSWTATLQFEATIDGTNWFAVSAFGSAGGSGVTSTTTNGQWTVSASGWTLVRVRVSAFTSGTASINLEGAAGNSIVRAAQGDPNSVANAWPTEITDGTDVAAVSATGRLLVSAINAEDVFGQLVIGQRLSQIQVSFNALAPSALVTVTTSGTGNTSGPNNGLGSFATGSGVTSQATGVTTNNVAYSPHQELFAAFTAEFTPPTAASSYQRIGLYNATDGFAFGYSGTTFGLWTRFNTTDTFVAQSSWNGDTCQGGSSKFQRAGSPESLFPNRINLYRIRFGWLGIAPVLFEILSPDGNWIVVHTVRYPNQGFSVSVTNPNLPLTVDVSKTASDATDLAIMTGCWVAGTSAATVPNFVGSGTILSNGASVLIPTAGVSALTLTISGSWTGTLAFQYSVDGINWKTDIVYDQTTGTFISSTTTNKTIEAPIASYRQYRVTSTAWSTGLATILYSTAEGGNWVHTQTLLTDGSANGPAAVKPASTAAVATDPALVVAVSPNTATPITTDRTTSGSITGAGQTVALSAVGLSNVAFQFAGTWVTTLVFEGTVDNTTWSSIPGFQVGLGGGGLAALTTSTSHNGIYRVAAAGLLSVRVRSSAYTSGTATVTVEGSVGSIAPVFNGFTDPNNYTSTALGSGVQFVGGLTPTAGYDVIYLRVSSDQSSGTNGVQVQWSHDTTSLVVDTEQRFTYTGSSPIVYQFRVRAPFYRILYTNGGTGQTTFELAAVLKVAPPDGTVLPGQTEGLYEVTRPTAIAGKDSTGVYRAVRSGSDGNLSTNRTVSANVSAQDGAATLSTDGLGAISIQLSGTWSGTMQFEGSVDSSTYTSIYAVPVGGGPTVASVSSNGQWLIACGGLASVRVRCSTFVSGPIVTLVVGAPVSAAVGSVIATPSAASQSSAISALNGTVSITVNGPTGFYFASGSTFKGTLVAEVAITSGTLSTSVIDTTTGQFVDQLYGPLNENRYYEIVIPSGATTVQLRASAYESGSVTVNIRSSWSPSTTTAVLSPAGVDDSGLQQFAGVRKYQGRWALCVTDSRVLDAIEENTLWLRKIHRVLSLGLDVDDD